MTRPRGLDDGAARQALRWFDERTVHAGGASRRPGREPVATVAVVIPARNEARAIGQICEVIAGRLLGGLVDELIVMDCDSTDRTAEIATAAGARVQSARAVLPHIPWMLGKGEAMWRSLAVVDADIVCFIDGDIRNFDPRFVERLVSPLREDPGIAFAKGFYCRPLKVGSSLVPAAGGRVTELTARPLLNLLFPELAGFLQPLAGEYAGRTEVLRRVPFFTGYGVDVALLIDLAATVGLDAMIQVDLDERVHRNRPLRELRMTATAVAAAILDRARRDGRITLEADLDRSIVVPGADASLEIASVTQTERPPIIEVLQSVSHATKRP